jgi:hypothetical protein
MNYGSLSQTHASFRAKLRRLVASFMIQPFCLHGKRTQHPSNKELGVSRTCVAEGVKRNVLFLPGVDSANKRQVKKVAVARD